MVLEVFLVFIEIKANRILVSFGSIPLMKYTTHITLISIFDKRNKKLTISPLILPDNRDKT